jgi:hypothetical protein
MKLTDFASELVAKNHFIKASIGGFAGSGKSRTASELLAGAYKDMGCTKPILIIDNEKGSRFLIPFFQQHGIKPLLKETVELADVLTAFDYLKNGEIDFLFMDSLSKVWYRYVRQYRENREHFKNGKQVRAMTMKDWGTILPDWQEKFSDRFVEVPGNIIFTGRGGFTYEMEENEETHKKEFVKTGVKMKLAGETPFEPDLNIWMELNQEITKDGLRIWREAQVMKDRADIIDGKTFINPTYKDFQPVVRYLMGVPVGDVKGASSTENLAPKENEGFYAEKQARDIEVEKIKAIFDKAALGTSKEDKQLRTLIFEKFLGTTSMTEFEKMDVKSLYEARWNLEHMFSKWGLVPPEERKTLVESFTIEKATGDVLDLWENGKKASAA